MELYKALNKYRRPLSMHKTKLYEFLEQEKENIKAEGFPYHTKDWESLFRLEVIATAIQYKKQCKDIYHQIRIENKRILVYLTYQERQNIIAMEMDKAVQSMAHFDFEGTLICLPYLERHINRCILRDYEAMDLRKYKNYISSYPKRLENITDLYGWKPFESTFSQLQYVGHDTTYRYFYFESQKALCIFDGEYHLVTMVGLVDRYHDYLPKKEEVATLVQQIISGSKDREVLEYMYENGFISAVGYKKISKKIG